jgi:regulator of protease activity HflC (stomatin/prohibitin superfamily)
MTWKTVFTSMEKGESNAEDAPGYDDASTGMREDVENVAMMDPPDSSASGKKRLSQKSSAPAATRRREWQAPEIHCCDTNTKRILWAIFILAVFLTGISLLARSLQRLESTEYGVEYNTHKKVLADAAKTGGLHIGSPGYEFIKFPSTYITVDIPEDTCVSQDGLRVKFQVTFQYQLPSEWVVPVTIKYRDFDKWATIVEVAGKSAIQHACSEFSIVEFQTARGIIQTKMETDLTLKLEGPEKDGASGVYARAISLQLRNVDVPELYRQSVNEKQEASEDIELAKNQRTQEITKARTELLAASEEARKIKETAENEAALILTEARLKAEETTFAFQTEAETILRVKSSLNLTTEGILAFMANQLVAQVPDLKVTAGEPAKLSRKEEL